MKLAQLGERCFLKLVEGGGVVGRDAAEDVLTDTTVIKNYRFRALQRAKNRPLVVQRSPALLMRNYLFDAVVEEQQPLFYDFCFLVLNRMAVQDLVHFFLHQVQMLNKLHLVFVFFVHFAPLNEVLPLLLYFFCFYH